MTPVYNVAIADWRTNSCSVYQYVARPTLSVFFKITAPKNTLFSPIGFHLFLCCFHYLKKHIFQYFHFIMDETNKYLRRNKKHQATKNKSLLTNKSSKQDVLSKYPNHDLYNSEENPLTECNLAKSSTDVLWQQARLELKMKKLRVMYFVATSKSNRRTTPQLPLTRRSNAA